jgi:hypothetical protein
MCVCVRERQQKRDGERFNGQCELNYIAMGGHMYGHTKESFKKTRGRLYIEKAFSVISCALHRYHCQKVTSNNVKVLL